MSKILENTLTDVSSSQTKAIANLDNPTLQIATKKLNGENFFELSQSTKLFLTRKDKIFTKYH